MRVFEACGGWQGGHGNPDLSKPARGDKLGSAR